ncbi:hypothetical protein C8J57DRAFT_1536886 [Mycena rebaudengoi]|nr:hypothetical protein C8J57DRAFT_1536886 [Mycena rebaudengoi]
MANPDADMPMPYEDSEFYIEDWTTRSNFHQHKRAGFWTGDTYVAAIGDSLDMPPPPWGNFATPAPGQHPPAPMRPFEPHTNRGWGAPAWGSTNTPGPFAHKQSQDDPRLPNWEQVSPSGPNPFAHKHSQAEHHWELPQHREDVLHQQVMHSRPRFWDEAYWGRAPRRPRSPHWETASTATGYSACLRDDHRRVMDDNRAPVPSSQIGHQYGSNDAPRIVVSPDLRQAPRASDTHPQAPAMVRCNDPDYVGLDDDIDEDYDYVT